RAFEGSLAELTPIARRLAMTTIGGVTVIDDSYNSSPRAVRASLETAREVADGLGDGSRLIVALGDMLELGELAAAAHTDAVRAARAARPAAFVTAGPEMSRAVVAANASDVVTAADSAEAGRIVAGLVRPGDVVLVKGSFGMAMDRVIEAL